MREEKERKEREELEEKERREKRKKRKNKEDDDTRKEHNEKSKDKSKNKSKDKLKEKSKDKSKEKSKDKKHKKKHSHKKDKTTSSNPKTDDDNYEFNYNIETKPESKPKKEEEIDNDIDDIKITYEDDAYEKEENTNNNIFRTNTKTKYYHFKNNSVSYNQNDSNTLVFSYNPKSIFTETIKPLENKNTVNVSLNNNPQKKLPLPPKYKKPTPEDFNYYFNQNLGNQKNNVDSKYTRKILLKTGELNFNENDNIYENPNINYQDNKISNIRNNAYKENEPAKVVKYQKYTTFNEPKVQEHTTKIDFLVEGKDIDDPDYDEDEQEEGYVEYGTKIITHPTEITETVTTRVREFIEGEDKPIFDSNEEEIKKNVITNHL